MTTEAQITVSVEGDIVLSLGYWEARNLLFAIRAAKYKTEKSMRATLEFTPEPGRINLNEARLESLNSAGDKLLKALTEWEDKKLARGK